MDMLALNDSRRIARIGMVVDEVYKAIKLIMNDHKPTFSIGINEFKMCGGSKISKTKTSCSLYRQVVYCERDVHALTYRGRFPSSTCIKKANSLYCFYDSDNDEEEKAPYRYKDFLRIIRVMLILRKARTLLKKLLQSDNIDEMKKIVFAEKLFKDEMISFGYRKNIKDVKYCFVKQLNECKRDIRKFITRGRFPPPSTLSKCSQNYPDNKIVDNEDVDDFDYESHDDKSNDDKECIKEKEEEEVEEEEVEEEEEEEEDDDDEYDCDGDDKFNEKDV